MRISSHGLGGERPAKVVRVVIVSHQRNDSLLIEHSESRDCAGGQFQLWSCVQMLLEVGLPRWDHDRGRPYLLLLLCVHHVEGDPVGIPSGS